MSEKLADSAFGALEKETGEKTTDDETGEKPTDDKKEKGADSNMDDEPGSAKWNERIDTIVRSVGVAFAEQVLNVKFCKE